MKVLIKGTVAGFFGLLVCISPTKAENLSDSGQSHPRTGVISTGLQPRLSVYKDTIAFLEEKLVLAASNQKSASKSSGDVPVGSSIKTTASFFPANTPLLAVVSTKAEAWGSLTRFHAFYMAQQAILQFMPKGSNVNFDYTRDVQSWLGDEIFLGFMPKLGTTPVTLESNFVVVASIRDQTRLQLFIDALSADKDKVKVRQYLDATIFEVKTSTPTPKANSKLKINKQNNLAIATFSGNVALTFNVKSLEQLIDNKSTNIAKLADNPDFQGLTQLHNRDTALFSMYQNPYEYVTFVKDFAKDPNLSIPLPALEAIKPEQFKAYSSINSSMRLQPEGLRFQVQTFLAKTQGNKSGSKGKDKIISRMPAATYSTFTGNNLSLQWQTFANVLNTAPELKGGLQSFRQFVRTITGLDFDKEIVGWMDKEYGFFLFPTKGGLSRFISSDFNLGIGLVVETTNRQVAQNTINKLEQLVKSVSGSAIVVKNSNIKGQGVTSWDIANSPHSLFAYSWLNENTLVLTSGYGAIADLVPKPSVLLSSAYNFNTATNSLPDPNQGYFYVNMGSFLSWFYGFIPQEYQKNPYFQVFKQAIGSVYSFSATTSKMPEYEQFDILTVLAPNRKTKM